MFENNKQDRLNQEAFDHPQVGDYWHEMFCPYFIIVQIQGSTYTILSCLGGPGSFSRQHEPNARVDQGDGTWSFDYSQSMMVDRAWIEKTVKYSSFDGFVADVIRSEKTQKIVTEWRDWYQKNLRAQIDKLESKWEHFTGWKALKEAVDNDTTSV